MGIKAIGPTDPFPHSPEDAPVPIAYSGDMGEAVSIIDTRPSGGHRETLLQRPTASGSVASTGIAVFASARRSRAPSGPGYFRSWRIRRRTNA
jgi:hypothetical protein